MKWTLPGTVLTADPTAEDMAEKTFSTLFLTGGLVLSQVTQISGLEPYIVQNWVRRGFVPPPQQRKYTRRQLSRILTINALKTALSIEQVCTLLRFINGMLDDESDDIIDDTDLYMAFLSVVRMIQLQPLSAHALDKQILRSLAQYDEPFPGAKNRVQTALRIMVTAWRCTELQQHVQYMMSALAAPNEPPKNETEGNVSHV